MLGSEMTVEGVKPSAGNFLPQASNHCKLNFRFFLQSADDRFTYRVAWLSEMQMNFISQKSEPSDGSEARKGWVGSQHSVSLKTTGCKLDYAEDRPAKEQTAGEIPGNGPVLDLANAHTSRSNGIQILTL